MFLRNTGGPVRRSLYSQTLSFTVGDGPKRKRGRPHKNESMTRQNENARQGRAPSGMPVRKNRRDAELRPQPVEAAVINPGT